MVAKSFQKLFLSEILINSHKNSCVNSKETVDKIQHWSDVWLLKINVDKCKVVSYSRQVEKNKYVMVQNIV